MDAECVKKLLNIRPDLGAIQENLTGGLSDSCVFKVVSGKGPAVLKLQKDKRELHFYSEIASNLFPGEAWLAEIYDYGEIADWNWILMEFIPGKLPPDRWNFDSEILGILRKIHSTPIGPDTFDWSDSHWSREKLDVAKRYLSTETNRKLDLVHQKYTEIASQNLVLCSGDANAPNWLLRESGTPVLIDWQILTRANKALDIAGWIATMLTFSELEYVARNYLCKGTDEETISLAKDIAIFFCRRCATNFWHFEESAFPERWKPGIERMEREFPSWLDLLIKDAKFV